MDRFNYSIIGAFIERPETIADCRTSGLKAKHFNDSFESLAFEAIEKPTRFRTKNRFSDSFVGIARDKQEKEKK